MKIYSSLINFLKTLLKPSKENTLLILNKLLYDSLFGLIIFFTLTLIAEAILPTIVIAHIGFSKIIILILTNILLIKLLTQKITSKQTSTNESLLKFSMSFVFFGILLIFNNQLGINIFFSLFLILIYISIGYLSYKILFCEK